MKILAVVVTYYPEEKLLKKDINAFINYVDKVLIWENTPEIDKLSFRFIHDDKIIKYCGDGVNSISHALNYAWRYAKENGYDYLLTMDQDSCFMRFDYYFNQTVQNKKTPKGIYSPHIVGTEINSDFEEINMPITSGMLIPVYYINMIGGWDETFKIDSVDDEFCLHAHSLGIKTYAVKGAMMNQRFGEPETRNVCGHTINLRNYTPDRLYFIYKNNIILIRRYPQLSYIKDNFINVWIKQIVWLFFEKNTIRKLLSVFKGCIIGLVVRV